MTGHPPGEGRRSRPAGNGPANVETATISPDASPSPGHLLSVEKQIGAPDAERALLGLAMFAPSAAADLLQGLIDDDFVDPRHRVILTAIRRCLDDHAPPEPVVVIATMRAAGEVSPFTADTDPGAYLVELVRAVGVPGAGPQYRRAVLEASWRRRCVNAAERITQAAEEQSLDELALVIGCELSTVLAARAFCPPASPSLRVAQ